METFKDKTLREIRVWAWIAAVVPISSLAALFFIWVFGTDRIFNIAMIVGETTMFTMAVIWWWWAIYVIKNVIRQWDITKEGVAEVLIELKEIKVLAKETFIARSDK